MRMSIVIDDDLMAEALDASGYASKKETVEEALKLLIMQKNHPSIKNFSGKIRWEGDLDKMRADIRKRRDCHAKAHRSESRGMLHRG
jgi:Arc/MetJ family transcription regulator